MDGLDLSKIPGAMPPPGVTPNFVNPTSMASLPRIFTYVTLPLMGVFLFLRLYTRIVVTRQLGMDDYLCVIAAGLICSYCGLLFTVLDNPAGPHMWDIPVSKLMGDYGQKSTLTTAIYIVSAMFIKSSILSLYNRIFSPVQLAKILIWIGYTIVILFTIISVAVFCAGCVPRAEDWALGGWLSLTFAKRCDEVNGPIAAACGIAGTIMDFYILAIPLVLVSKLRTTNSRKAGIIAIFLTGLIACIFSVVGTVYRVRILATRGYDISWTSMPIYAMGIGEINVGIMCSCMPVIFVLFKGFTKQSASWVSKLRYITSGGRKPSNPSGASDIRMLHYEEVDENKLPQIPKGTLTGLRSFMRNKDRTRPIKTETAMTMDTMKTYASNDYDYHHQLKADAAAASHRDLSAPLGYSASANSQPHSQAHSYNSSQSPSHSPSHNRSASPYDVVGQAV